LTAAAAAGQSSGKRAVAEREPGAPVTGEQTGEELEQLDEEELEVQLPVGLRCLLLHVLGSWRTHWSWRGVLLALPEVGWAKALRVGLLEVQDVEVQDVPCHLIHLDWSFLGLWQDSEGRSQGSWAPQRRV